jgi:hypothetical protein
LWTGRPITPTFSGSTSAQLFLLLSKPMGRAMHSSFRDLGELRFAFSYGTDASRKRMVANQPTCWSPDSKPKSASSVW